MFACPQNGGNFMHHCVLNLDTTLRNVARMVRLGGHFMMMEPNDDFVLSAVRRTWYRKGRWFEADTEAALKYDEIAVRAEPYFALERVHYFGESAFYLILNSLITCGPRRAKPALSPMLSPIESIYNKLSGRAPFAVWRRTDAAA